MPIYEYEPKDRDCQMCEGRFEWLQAADEPPLEFCPFCGLSCKRVVSKANFTARTSPSAEAAAKKGFTTFRRSGKGHWEKVAGVGVDAIVATPEQIAEVEAETKTKPKKVVDLGP